MSLKLNFIAVNAAGKDIKYIRMVLTDLDLPPNGPSPIWEDNESVLKIVNNLKSILTRLSMRS